MKPLFNQSTYLLTGILTLIILAVTGITSTLLYNTAIHEERARLLEIVTSQARLMESVARFDLIYSKQHFPGGAEQATLMQIREAHETYRGFGKTSEFSLARLNNDRIEYLLRHSNAGAAATANLPASIRMGDDYAVPMQHALRGRSGTIIARDYRGVEVLAAYEPVQILNYGIVSKIDLAEIRDPFIRSGLISIMIGVVLTLLGAWAFQRVTQPLLERTRRSEARMRLLLNSAGEGIYGIDIKGDCIFANLTCVELLGYASDEELLGQHMHQLIHHHHADGKVYPVKDCQIYRAVQQVRGIKMDNEVFWRKDGSSFPCEYYSHPIIENGICSGAVVSFKDISERRHAEEQGRLASTVFDNISEGIMVTDAQRRILRVNRAFTQMTGYSAEEVMGKSPGILHSDRQSPEFYTDMWKTLETTGRWNGEIWNRRKNGEAYPQLETISAVFDDQGELTHYVAAFADISALKETEFRLQHLAHHDALTGLPNRLLFNARFELSIQRAERNKLTLAILFIDLDGFKSINDLHGHETGDALLQEMAQRMNSLLRREDTVSRLGGDEFAILLGGVFSNAEIDMLAQKILDAINAPLLIMGKVLSVSGSIGISLFPDDGSGMADLLKKADKAMYLAKHAGKNRFAYYHQD